MPHSQFNFFQLNTQITGRSLFLRVLICGFTLSASPVFAQTPTSNEWELDPKIIENSPVLQRWQRQIPNVLEDIQNDPSFRTRLRFGYAQFPSSGQAGGVAVGVEDVFLGQTRLTLSGDYQTAWNGDRSAYGAEIRYYLRPLGRYVNLAPVVGYRHLETTGQSTEGLKVGARFVFALSRSGAADLALQQSWISPGSSEEVGITNLSVGYALNSRWRISTDIEKQNSRFEKDSRVGVMLEWMP